MPFSDAEKLRCLERELKFRNHTYPKRIEAGKMTERQAAREIHCIEDIAAEFVERVRASEHSGERKLTGQDFLDWKADHDRDTRKHE